MAHPVMYFEIGCRDLAATRKFYSDVFEWEIGSKHNEVNPAGGIPGHFNSLGHEPHQYVTFYIQVDDIEAALERIVSNGGKTVVPPVAIGGGIFAWFSDPGGNVLGLWQPTA